MTFSNLGPAKGGFAFVAALSRKFDQLSEFVQFSFLVGGVFVFFGIHNILQEAMMKVDGFTYGVMLGYMEVFGVTVCSFLERKFVAKEKGMIAPLSAYPLLTFCLMSSSSLSNSALNYINFPTKVIFRSCKLIPTMLLASMIHRKVFSSKEYGCALAMCLGLVLFAAAEWRTAPAFHPIGWALVSLSVCADSILPNAQERVFQLGATRLEVTFFTNILTLMAMTVTTFLTGDLAGAAKFALSNQSLQLMMLVYIFVAYIAISVHMTIVKRYGGVTAVVVATVRKGMTLVLSFVLFPKKFSWLFVLGAILVLGGAAMSSLLKVKDKGSSENTKSHSLTHKASGDDLEKMESSLGGEIQHETHASHRHHHR